jgi:addiction module RelE/StbE family toxin
MYLLVASTRFKKNLKLFFKKHPELKPVFEERTTLLQADPKNPRLKTHTLTGKLKGTFALSITYEHRLVFTIEETTIHLLAIGTHDEVY